MRDKDFEQELARRGIRPGALVRHFKYPEKGLEAFYIVECFATHSETGEELVIYRQVSTRHFRARPLDMFLSRVDREKYPDAPQEYRFELCEECDE